MRYTQFFTATILNWQNLLEDDACKDIIIAALKHRVALKQVRIFGFVIMPNHMHLIWYINPDIKKENFQRDLLKYISKQIILYLKASAKTNTLNAHTVNAKDRMIQIWERNSLSIDIYSLPVFTQKLNYIHCNPLQEKWQLSEYAEGYRYSSARYYLTDIDDFQILSNFMKYY